MADGDPVAWSDALHAARGSGSGSRSRLDFAKLREAGWQILSRQSGKKQRTDFVDREGRKFKSAKDVERKLESDGTLDEFVKADVVYEDKTVPASENTEMLKDSDEEYEPPYKQKAFEDVGKSGITVPEGLFVATTSSIVNFVDEFNQYFHCPSMNGKCKGKLALTAYQKKGYGGAMTFTFKCYGCWTVNIDYKSSYLAVDTRRQLVSLALSLAFFISGHGYAGYRKALGRGLGLGVVSEKPYLEVIDLALPHIKSILDEMCEDAKQQMKDLPPDQIGSWTKAVTCCDGCWLIRGHFSQNCTFVVKNYLTGALLYYGHLSMRGADTICDEELWQGTAKAAEGHLSQVLWARAKDEGLNVAVNWQDADSSSAKGFRHSFSNEHESKIMLCGGHVGRAHGRLPL